MNITIYSLITTIIWSSIFVLIMYLFRKNDFFIKQFGATFLFVLVVGSIIRLLLPFEFAFTKDISVQRVYSTINSFLYTQIYHEITVLTILLTIWVIGIVFFLCKLIVVNAKYYKKCNKLVKTDSDLFSKIVESVCGDSAEKITISQTDTVSSPVMLGFFKAHILIPTIDYSEDEYILIIKHEYAHFINKDNFTKLLAEVFCAIFWWNPFAYLIKKDVQRTLEIKCDLSVVGTESESTKDEYLSTILKTLKHASNTVQPASLVTAEMAANNNIMKQRFKVVQEYKANDKRQVIFNLVLSIFLVSTMFLSYAFVFQPYYEAPIDDYIDYSDDYEVIPDDIYLEDNNDGTYTVHFQNGETYIITEESAGAVLGEGF